MIPAPTGLPSLIANDYYAISTNVSTNHLLEFDRRLFLVFVHQTVSRAPARAFVVYDLYLAMALSVSS